MKLLNKKFFRDENLSQQEGNNTKAYYSIAPFFAPINNFLISEGISPAWLILAVICTILYFYFFHSSLFNSKLKTGVERWAGIKTKISKDTFYFITGIFLIFIMLFAAIVSQISIKNFQH
jgi:hypothetical protein